jgi:hypothetical protein
LETDALDVGNMMTEDSNMGVIIKEIMMEAIPAIRPTPIRTSRFFQM